MKINSKKKHITEVTENILAKTERVIIKEENKVRPNGKYMGIKVKMITYKIEKNN